MLGGQGDSVAKAQGSIKISTISIESSAPYRFAMKQSMGDDVAKSDTKQAQSCEQDHSLPMVIMLIKVWTTSASA